jgi:DNA-binding transcriptional ArsR family regulator
MGAFMIRKMAAEEIAKFMEVVSHPARLEIISELKDKESDVTSLQFKIGVSQSRMSQHLSALRKAGILKVRRDGRQVFYRLEWPELTSWVASSMNMLLKHNFSDGQPREAVESTVNLWSEK